MNYILNKRPQWTRSFTDRLEKEDSFCLNGAGNIYLGDREGSAMERSSAVRKKNLKFLCGILGTLVMSGCGVLVQDVSGFEPDDPFTSQSERSGVSREHCVLCGNKGEDLAAQLKTDLGMIHFNTGKIVGIPVMKSDEADSGNETGNYASSYIGRDDPGSRISFSAVDSRGICEASIKLNEDSVFDSDLASNYFCTDCLKAIDEIDGEMKNFMKEEDLVDVALIDLTEFRLYSLNQMQKAYFIWDYYIHIDRNDELLKVLIVNSAIK